MQKFVLYSIAEFQCSQSTVAAQLAMSIAVTRMQVMPLILQGISG